LASDDNNNDNDDDDDDVDDDDTIPAAQADLLVGQGVPSPIKNLRSPAE